jgi:ethanolamine utilization protein EutN
MQAEGIETICLDVVDAGVGDRVLVVQEGSSARRIFGDDWIPVQAVIVGVLDRVDLHGRQVL